MSYFNNYLWEYGRNILFYCLAAIAVLYYFRFRKLLLLAIGFLLFTYYFFRKPRIIIPFMSDKIIFAPSFGKVVKLEEMIINGMPYVHVACFLSVFDPHIQYSPVNGVLNRMLYKKGKFHPAMFVKKSEKNERLNYYIETTNGQVIVTQIAGMIARSIVPFVQPSNYLRQGDEIGMIKFGSRVDTFIPKKMGMNLFIKEGDYLKGGSSIIASYIS